MSNGWFGEMSYFANVFRGMLKGLEDLLTHGESIGEWEKRERKGYTLIEVLSSEPRYEKTLWVLLPALSREEKVGQKNKTEKKSIKKGKRLRARGKKEEKKKKHSDHKAFPNSVPIPLSEEKRNSRLIVFQISSTLDLFVSQFQIHFFFFSLSLRPGSIFISG